MSAPTDDLQPTRTNYVAPSGARITVVLAAIAVGIVVLCVACLVGYMFYVDRRQR